MSTEKILNYDLRKDDCLSTESERNIMDINAAYRRKRIILFLAISVGYLVVFFQRVAPAIVGPVMADELGLAATDLGIMASMYFWAQAAGCIPAGLFSDTFGPRKIIAVGLICASAGTAVFVMGMACSMLALGRFIIGLSVSVVFVGAMKIFSDWFYPNELATCSGVLLAVGNLGALLSTRPLMWLIEQAGWRDAFWFVTAYTLFSGILAWMILRNTPKECGFPEIAATSQETVSMRSALKEVFRTHRFYLVTIASTLYYGTLMNVGGLWSGPYLQDVYGLSKDVASSIVMCFTLGMIIGCPVSGWLSDKIVRSRKKVLLLGIILHTLVYIPLAFFTASIGTPTLLYLLFTLFGFTGGFFVVCFACVKETTEPRYAATAVGGLNMGIAVGAAFFQYVCGLIIDSHGKVGSVYGADAYASAFQLCMVMMIVGAVFMFFFKEKTN